MRPTPRDRVLLLLAIKKEGKRIDFDHIAEKTREAER